MSVIQPAAALLISQFVRLLLVYSNDILGLTNRLANQDLQRKPIHMIGCVKLHYIQLSDIKNPKVKIMLFTEGTVIMHTSLEHIFDYATYKPIGSSVELIRKWNEQGAEIVYCTSRKGNQATIIADVLKKYGFCGTKLYYRSENQTYSEIVEHIKPHILIEDDCQSIGGKSQMCISNVNDEIKRQIHSIAVPEFGGIDHLPVQITELLRV